MINFKYFAMMIYALGIFFVFYFYSPVIAVKDIHQGFKMQNVQQLSHYIDYASIRESIIEQLKTEVVLKSEDIQKKMELDHPLLISEITNMMDLIEQFLNPYISEKGLLLLFQSKERLGVNFDQSRVKSFTSVLSSKSFWDNNALIFESFGNVHLITQFSNKTVKLVFVFTGIKWVLTDVQLDLSHSSTEDIIQFMEKYSTALKVS